MEINFNELKNLWQKEGFKNQNDLYDLTTIEEDKPRIGKL